MSGFNLPRAAPQAQQPKQMSSRLMTMKFMQRAANSERSQSQPQTPSSEPPSKKRRTDDSTPSSNMSAPSHEKTTFFDRKSMAAAVKAEEEVEALARARNFAGGVETQWVLNLDLPATNGQASQVEDEDSSYQQDSWSYLSGRQTYGSFKRKKKTPKLTKTVNVDNETDLSAGSDSESESASDNSSSSEDETPQSRTSKKRKPQGLDYEDAAEMDRLDRVDLSKSSYARSKGAFNPSSRDPNFGDKGRSRKSGGGGNKKKSPNKKKKARITM